MNYGLDVLDLVVKFVFGFVVALVVVAADVVDLRDWI
jgi:hypothetical protein